jgi:hypothetical protein
LCGDSIINDEKTMTSSDARLPIDASTDRAARNFQSATGMLAHLCALYDSGVVEAARLMSNIASQLAVARRQNVPLLAQVGLLDDARIVIEEATRGAHVTASTPFSPLVTLISGVRTGEGDEPQPVAMWLPAFCRPPPFTGRFASLTVDEWLDDPAIPIAGGRITRRRLIECVRDQDGGAHVGPQRGESPDDVDLVNAFPISNKTSIEVLQKATKVSDLLLPVTLPVLRQVAHELLSAIWWFVDPRVHLSSLVCKFEGTSLRAAFVPELYPNVGPVYGVTPTVVKRGA